MRLIDADALIEFCAERWIPLNIDAVNMQPTIEPKKNKCNHEHCPLQYNYVSDDCDILECPWRTVHKQGYWTEIGKDIYVNLENAREQYEVLGYPHRVILKLQCSECRMITCVDSSIAYEFCPHCGADMREENES